MNTNGKCGCRCCGSEMLSIPRGNDFRVHVCSRDIVTGMKDEDVDFGEVDDLKGYLTTWLGRRTEAEFEIDTNGKDFIFMVPADMQKCTVYGIELTGTYKGRPWRWKAGSVFRIVETNCESSVQPVETLGVETYYAMDVVLVKFEDDTMTLYSDGHVHFDGDALILQDTEDTTFEIDGKILYITTNE